MQTVTIDAVRAMAEAAAGAIDRIFLHWSAGHYGQPFPDYHLNIDADGTLYAPGDDLTATLAHTWHQNTGSVAVSLLCCAFADTNSLGAEPPTAVQIDTMARVVAVLCRGLGLPCDFDHVRTHAEQADLDGYGPATTCERWDLWYLSDGDPPGSGGDALRAKALACLAEPAEPSEAAGQTRPSGAKHRHRHRRRR